VLLEQHIFNTTVTVTHVAYETKQAFYRRGFCIASKRERPRKTWRRQAEAEIRGIGLRKEDVLNRARWRNGVKLIMSRWR